MPASQPLPGALRTMTRSSLGRSRTPLAPTARPVRRAAPTLLGTTPAASRCLSSRPPARRPLLLLPPPPPPPPRTAAAAAAARHYHPTTTSAQQPPTSTVTTTPPFSATEAAILAAAYAHVPAHGFTARALALGARDAGYPPVSAAAGALSDPGRALVRWHLAAARTLLAERARELSPTAAAAAPATTQDEVNARAEALAWERLLLNAPVIGRWQEAQAIMAQPTFAPECLGALAALADDVWALAGDAAVDPTWYAKRAALSAVYASAELYMTADRSEGFRETREFLRRRFAETAELGRAAQSVGQWLGFTAAAGLNVLRSKGVNI